MKPISFFIAALTCLFASMSPITGHAQFFKSLLDNVKNTAQGRANAKASQTTNNVIDKVDPTTPKPASASTPSAASSTTAASSSSSSTAVSAPGSTQPPASGTTGGTAGKGAPPPGGNTESDSSYLTLTLSANKILLEDAVRISGNSIRYGSLKDVALTITGPQTNFSKTLPLTDSGAFKTTWQATVPGNYKVTVKSSNGKEQQTASLDVYRVVDLDSIINDEMTGLKHAYDNLGKQIDAIKGLLGQSDADQLQKTMDKVSKDKDQIVKYLEDLGTMGKGLDAIEKKYGGLPAGSAENLSQLSTMISTQAQEIKQANTIVDHKSYDLTICEALVIVSEACAAFSTFTNVWAKSSVLVIKNITLDKGIPNAASVSGAPAASAPMINEISKVGATSILDADQLFSVLGPAGFTGDLVQMCSNYFLKKYCVVMSGDMQQNYKCTFRNKNMVTYWDYSYKTEATISLRYPKSGSKGSIIKMKGNIEGNATKFTIYQKATEQDDFKDAKGYRASLFSICLYAPPTMPFSTSQQDRTLGFGAVARAIVTPAYFNIPIDADYNTETMILHVYCNEAIIDFSDQVKYVYGYIMIAAGIPLVTRVNYPINKAKLTIAKVIEKNNDWTMKMDANNNLSFSKSANFNLGRGSVIEHNIDFTVSAQSQ